MISKKITNSVFDKWLQKQLLSSGIGHQFMKDFFPAVSDATLEQIDNADEAVLYIRENYCEPEREQFLRHAAKIACITLGARP